jgi:hypothetical protein
VRAELFSLVLLCAGCEYPTPVPPEEPAFTCDTACENLRTMGCSEAEDTPEGSTCEDVCENSFDVGIPAFEWDVEQLTTAEACEDGS